VVQLKKVVPPGSADIVVKLEYFNPTGSYKDRMALAMIEEAEKRGALRPGMRVVEYTGGSTGSSVAMVCAVKGYRFEPLSSDAFAREKTRTMCAFGAAVTLLESEGGKITPGLFDRFKEEIAKRAAEPDTFYTDQMNNRDSILGYRKIGEELLEQLNGRISAFALALARRECCWACPARYASAVAGRASLRWSRPGRQCSRKEFLDRITSKGLALDSGLRC